MPSLRSAIVTMLGVCCTVLLASAQAGPARPAITGISHVAFRVSDLAAARGFYGSVLGLAERTVDGGNRLEYAVGHRQYLRLTPGLPADEDERLDHLAFATVDLHSLQSYLGARGVTIGAALEPCERGAFFVRDPDGHPIEFVQTAWPPARTAGAAAAASLSSRILHAGLIVRQEEAAHRFYRDVLGFSEIWRGGSSDAVTSWINMRVPEGTDYLEYMLTTGEPDRRQRGSSHHACLLVSDVQDAYETVAYRAAEPLRPPNVGRNGRWQLNLFDRDGTRIELMEPFRIR